MFLLLPLYPKRRDLLSQKVWLRAYRAYDSYTEDGRLRHWLMRIAQNTVKGYFRRPMIVNCVSLEDGDEVFWYSFPDADSELILFSDRGWGKRVPQDQFESQNRAGKGVRCFPFNKNGSNGRVLAGALLSGRDGNTDLLITQVRSPMTRLPRNDILLQNRQGKGMPYILAILDDVITGVYGVSTITDEQA